MLLGKCKKINPNVIYMTKNVKFAQQDPSLRSGSGWHDFTPAVDLYKSQDIEMFDGKLLNII